MKPMPTWPVILLFGSAVGAAVTAVLADATLLGFGNAFREYQTFITAMIALGTAVWAASPVFRQMRIQTAQAALDLLSRVEAETKDTVEQRQAVRRVAWDIQTLDQAE
jgi:hypothetical protein